MSYLEYYIVDVFANQKYEGNQLAVFLDLENQLNKSDMLAIAQEINFAESTFIKNTGPNHRYKVRIFTPEYEVPFAGHPSLGTSYIISKFLSSQKIHQLILELKQGEIKISIENPDHLEESVFYMYQTPPVFKNQFKEDVILDALKLPQNALNQNMPIQEISTGLPYIIIPMTNLKAMDMISLDKLAVKDFLFHHQIHKSNSTDQLTTCFFFFSPETYEQSSHYNTRMLGLENNIIVEDAATGSANGCFLAYLLKYQSTDIKANVEQGFQMHRKSYIYLEGKRNEDNYMIKVGGRSKLVSKGIWYL